MQLFYREPRQNDPGPPSPHCIVPCATITMKSLKYNKEREGGRREEGGGDNKHHGTHKASYKR